MLAEIEEKLHGIFAGHYGPTPKIRVGSEISKKTELSIIGSHYMYCSNEAYTSLAVAEAEAALGDRGPFNFINLSPDVGHMTAVDYSTAPDLL